mmetsp:Transcript_18294/g.44177  ORF Transcript_18294/g.44177 Transcript_18294/m.44177 type:complete len:361 (+) Transcript_18294:418-1500(+)
MAKKSKSDRQKDDIDKGHTNSTITVSDETKTKAEENDRQQQRGQRRRRQRQEENDPAAAATDEDAAPPTSLRRSTNGLGRRGTHPLTLTPGAFWVRAVPRTGTNNRRTSSIDVDVACNDDDVTFGDLDDETLTDVGNDARTGRAITIIGPNNDEDSSVYVIPRASLVVVPGDGDSVNASENNDIGQEQCTLPQDCSATCNANHNQSNDNDNEDEENTTTHSNRRNRRKGGTQTRHSKCFRRSILGALIILIAGLLTTVILVSVLQQKNNGHDGHIDTAAPPSNESSNQLDNNPQQQPSPSPSKSPQDNNKKNCGGAGSSSGGGGGGSGGGKRRLGSSSSSSNGQQNQKQNHQGSSRSGRC